MSDDLRSCGNATGSSVCPDGFTCLQRPSLPNPMHGRPAFDYFPQSYQATVRLANRDYWEEILHKLIVTSGTWSSIFPCLVVLICSFYLSSLIWAQIAVSYKHLEIKKWEKELVDDVNATDSNDENDGNVFDSKSIIGNFYIEL